MCEKKQFKYCPSKIDECMKNKIKIFKTSVVEPLSCCCGHGKYKMTIVVKFRQDEGDLQLFPFDFISGKVIPRRKRFYKKDKQGYYFIPETIKNDTK